MARSSPGCYRWGGGFAPIASTVVLFSHVAGIRGNVSARFVAEGSVVPSFLVAIWDISRQNRVRCGAGAGVDLHVASAVELGSVWFGVAALWATFCFSRCRLCATRKQGAAEAGAECAGGRPVCERVYWVAGRRDDHCGFLLLRVVGVPWCGGGAGRSPHRRRSHGGLRGEPCGEACDELTWRVVLGAARQVRAAGRFWDGAGIGVED